MGALELLLRRADGGSAKPQPYQPPAMLGTPGLSALQMTHARSSGQMDPQLEAYLSSNERLNPQAGALEAPMFDPTDPSTWPVSPSALGKAALAKLGGLGALAGVIKQKGGNWLAGSVEDALRGLKRGTAMGGVNPSDIDPLNSWIDKQLTNYVKNQMATPEDPVRALAESGVLHVAPENLRRMGQDLESLRNRTGFPEQGVGQTIPGSQWENASDTNIGMQLAKDRRIGSQVSANPWLSVVPPETPTYHTTRGMTDNLGFDHLIDELGNALNPESGLPQHLLLNPNSLQRMGVPQAVQRVSEINAWRAAHKAEANQAIANNAATAAVRGTETGGIYAPENNPKGLRWVELKPSGEVKYNNTQEDKAVRDQLQDALKYEGDTMGHCVGGYCDDVLSGQSRIFSLRDAKGEPHVTVEVEPGYTNADTDELTPGRIVQIKGKQNRAPNPEYLPFVQDFVKNSPLGQPWSDVGDLQNTGLLQAKDLFGNSSLPTDAIHREVARIFPPAKSESGGVMLSGPYGSRTPSSELLDKTLQIKPLDQDYITKDELLQHLQSIEPQPVEAGYSGAPAEGYAKGGPAKKTAPNYTVPTEPEYGGLNINAPSVFTVSPQVVTGYTPAPAINPEGMYEDMFRDYYGMAKGGTVAPTLKLEDIQALVNALSRREQPFPADKPAKGFTLEHIRAIALPMEAKHA